MMDHENNWRQEPETTIQVASPEEIKKTVFTITEAARLNNVTRQAIYVAIKQKKLKATKYATRWLIKLDDLEDYKNNKYSRIKSTFEGELIFDNEKGFYSINQTAKMLNVPAQKIYYATRIGQLKAERKGAAWVISSANIKEYKEKFLTRPFGMEEISC